VGYGYGAGLFILDAVGRYDYAINHVYNYEHPLSIISNSSSRGLGYETGDFTMPDGTDWTYNNEVTIVAPGRYVISTRPSTYMVANGNLADSVIKPAYLSFFNRISGTSMATPHAAGFVALVMEANASLKIDKVKQLIKESATNIRGYEAWEVGADYINMRAALAAKGFDNNQRDTINNRSDTEFFANIDVQAHKLSEGKLALIVRATSN
jgi:serine protease AprX